MALLPFKLERLVGFISLKLPIAAPPHGSMNSTVSKTIYAIMSVAPAYKPQARSRVSIVALGARVPCTITTSGHLGLMPIIGVTDEVNIRIDSSERAKTMFIRY